MFSGGRGREVPFDVGCSGYERDIVQVDDLPSGSVGAMDHESQESMNHFELQIELWLKDYQPISLIGCACDGPFGSLVLSKVLSAGASSETTY